jgi:hypothetical protein
LSSVGEKQLSKVYSTGTQLQNGRQLLSAPPPPPTVSRIPFIWQFWDLLERKFMVKSVVTFVTALLVTRFFLNTVNVGKRFLKILRNVRKISQNVLYTIKQLFLKIFQAGFFRNWETFL